MKNSEILFRIKKLHHAIENDFLHSYPSRERIVSPTQIRIIEYMIKNNKKAIFQKDLEKALGVKKATISDVLRTMEKYELLEKVPSNFDSRRNEIILKKKAIEISNNAKKEILCVEKKLGKNISKEEIKIFNEILDRMIENFNS